MSQHASRSVPALFLAAAALALAAPAHADVKTGVDAWTSGDYDKAVREWQAPAARGDADALFNMGQAYKLGRGVPKDLGKAEEMYGKAARLGHVRAADNYGILLFQTGRQKEAMPWIEASADRGEPRAMYILGVAAFNGDFAPKDWVRAYALMSRAASSGLAQAMTSLSAMNDAIPLEQRQMGTSLAGELERKAVETRNRELGAADLGVKPALPRPIAPSPAPAALASVALPPSSAGDPNTAGADYANPVVLPRPAAPRPVAPKPAAPRPATPKPQVAAAPSTSTAPAGGSWRVQLGAFSVRANADALWNKVKGRPELAGHPRADAGGSVVRLMAGGFSEAGATRACAALKAGGLSCIPVRP